eukprot:SAG31_NODE_2544_length_5534_cov_3.478197_1_plen_120_part_00
MLEQARAAYAAACICELKAPLITLCFQRLALVRGFEALKDDLVALEPALLLTIQDRLTRRTRDRLHSAVDLEIEAANKAIHGLNRRDWHEIKGFVNPPTSIRDAIAPAMCILLGVKVWP